MLLEPVVFVVSEVEIFRVLNEFSELVVFKLNEVFVNIVEFNVEVIRLTIAVEELVTSEESVEFVKFEVSEEETFKLFIEFSEFNVSISCVMFDAYAKSNLDVSFASADIVVFVKLTVSVELLKFELSVMFVKLVEFIVSDT